MDGIAEMLMKLENGQIEQMIQNQQLLINKINEAKFIMRKEKEKEENDQKNELLIEHNETRGMDGMIENMSDSSGHADNNNGGRSSIPPAPNINNNENKENEHSNEEQDDDVHNQEQLMKKVNEMREKNKKDIEKSVQNEMYTKDNPTHGL